MPTATYTTALSRYLRKPVNLVKITVPGDVAGSQVFRFQDKEAPSVSLQIGQNVKPYILGMSGRTVRISPDRSVTERHRVTVTTQDDPDASPFDSSVFTVTTGGSFWKRLIVAQPDYRGSAVEILRGFKESGFLESDFERIFLGRLEDIDFNRNGEVKVIVKDNLVFKDRQVPSPISDDNVINGTALLPGDNTITLINGSQVTPPEDIDSTDFMPLVLRLAPEETFEDVIIKQVSGNVVTVQDNFLNSSEDFSETANWSVTGGTTVTADQLRGPFGGETLKADKLEFAAATDRVSQESSFATDTGATMRFSTWLKGASAGTTTLRMTNGVATSTLQVSVTTEWLRFDMDAILASGAGNLITVSVGREVGGDLAEVFAFGTQLEKEEDNARRGFYVATGLEFESGINAGRGAFGTTKANHAVGTAIKEALIHRHQLDDEGIHPIVSMRDFVSRGSVVASLVNQTSFDDEFAFQESVVLRRGPAIGFTDTTILEPTNLNDLMGEVRKQFLIDFWTNEAGLFTVKLSYRGIGPGDTPTTLTDEKNIALRSSQILGNNESRRTRIFVYYNVRSGQDPDKPENFSRITISVDLTVESFSGERAEKILSSWIYRDNEAQALSGRRVGRFKRGARIFRCNLDVKDDQNIFVGDNFRINSNDILVASGTAAVRDDVVFQLMQKTDKRKRGQIFVEGLEQTNRRPGWISPSIGSPDFFPTDYDSATEAQQIYAFAGAATTNTVGAAADEGYSIQ